MVGAHINYFQPASMQELQSNLDSLTDESVILAGGTDLMISIRKNKPQIDNYLSLCSLNEMKGISELDGWVRIGAMVTHAEAAADNKIRNYFHALSMACDHIGSQQVRNKGTIGGSLMNATPAGDIMPCVMLFNGEIEIFSAEGKYRRININDFLSEKGKPTLSKKEVLVAIWLPVDYEKRSCFVKLGTRTEVTIAQISLCISWKKKENEYSCVKAYMGAVDSKPLKIDEAAEILKEKPYEMEKINELSALLSDKIRTIRINSKRESKLKVTECEKLYKERAVKGVVYDAVSYMKD